MSVFSCGRKERRKHNRKSVTKRLSGSSSRENKKKMTKRLYGTIDQGLSAIGSVASLLGSRDPLRFAKVLVFAIVIVIVCPSNAVVVSPKAFSSSEIIVCPSQAVVRLKFGPRPSRIIRHHVMVLLLQLCSQVLLVLHH